MIVMAVKLEMKGELGSLKKLVGFERCWIWDEKDKEGSHMSPGRSALTNMKNGRKG